MKNTLSTTSIKKQIIFLLFAVSSIISSAIFIYSTLSITEHEKERFVSESQMEARLLTDFILMPLAFGDAQGIVENLNILSSHKLVHQAMVFTADGRLFAGYNPKNLPVQKLSSVKNDFDKEDFFFANSEYTLCQKIIFNSKTVGYLCIKKDASIIFDYATDALEAFAIFSAVLILLVMLIGAKGGSIILEPILTLAESMQKIADEKNYAARVEYAGSNEISHLFSATNTLLEETYHLTTELELRVQERTKELQESVLELQLAQNQLIEAEKMAALGNLVSGVAHEVNTPVGNALTGGSIILREAQMMQKSLEDGSLKRSNMESSLSIITQSSSLLIKSLTQAAQLIRSFKQISVDQCTNDLREFDLVSYTNEILQTYHNKLKQKQIEVEIDAPKRISIYSYPGVFAQIFNNLLNNSLLHAFETKTSDAKIVISLKEDTQKLHIIFSDNGIGVDEKVLSTIFEPFVTTKRNAGGTGLGMHILYNLVTQKLKGAVTFESKKDEGTSFYISIPTTSHEL